MIYVLYFEQKVFAEISAEAASAYVLLLMIKVKPRGRILGLPLCCPTRSRKRLKVVFSGNREGSCFGREGETWGLLDLQQGPILGGPRDPPVMRGGLLVKDTKEVC